MFSKRLPILLLLLLPLLQREQLLLLVGLKLTHVYYQVSFIALADIRANTMFSVNNGSSRKSATDPDNVEPRSGGAHLQLYVRFRRRLAERWVYEIGEASDLDYVRGLAAFRGATARHFTAYVRARTHTHKTMHT